MSHQQTRSVSQRGESIGPYILERVIARSGPFVLWLAERRDADPAAPGRTVLIHLPAPGTDPRPVLARLEQERAALARLDHPFLARVIDAGTTDSGPYVVTDHVAGEPIVEFCDRISCTIRQRLELFMAVCEAVQHAHHKGLVHGALSPAHVLVTLQGSRAVPHVIGLGFGGAAGNGGRAAEWTSPEQGAPAADIDTRTDIYSLGALLYRLLTGQPPLEIPPEGDDAQARAVIGRQQPIAPSQRVGGAGAGAGAHAARLQIKPPQLVAALRADLDFIVMKCLEKDPARRYQSAGALALDLRRFLAGETVEAAPPSRRYRARRFVRRHTAGVVALGVALVGLVVGLALTVYTLAGALPARDRALLSARRAEAERRYAVEAQQQIEPFVRAAWKAAPLKAGELFFVSRGCAGCHTTDGRHWTGPTMKDLFGSTVELAEGGTAVADRQFIEEHILGPRRRIVAGFPPLMPSFEGQLDADTLNAIVLYIMSLSDTHRAEAQRQAREVQRRFMESLGPGGEVPPLDRTVEADDGP